MRKLFILFFIILVLQLSAQTSLTIPQIQGSGSSSSYTGEFIKTSGIVTAKYIGTNKINGFFLQDAAGDANTNTSDGIFVYTSEDNVEIGDKIQLTATVDEFSGKTELINPNIISIDSHGNALPVTKVIFNPETFSWEKYEGMLLQFDQTLYVNSNRNLQRYGELELGDIRKQSPTNFAFPGSTEYEAIVTRNDLLPIYLDDAITTSYYSPIVFADANGTRRTGERVDKLQAVVDYTNNKYVIYPQQFPVNFYGNSRPAKPTDLGDYNLTVCGFNLEYYLTSPNSSGLGPQSQTELEHQHTKIVAALKAIDADVYGLAEIEQGQAALAKLAGAMTSATGKSYNYIDDSSNINGTFTKVGYLYCADKVTPYKSLKENNSVGPSGRKKLQAFTLKSNGERFIFSINHFKAKSGCYSATGNDADQGDGQSCYNATRVAEANSTVSFINTNQAYYDDNDALVMGDLNAYTKEDPIVAFVDAGYKNMIAEFNSDTAYSYVFDGEIGCLDHALATKHMSSQITGVCTFHINADEPSMFEYSGSNYQPDMYRCSDHDPVVVGISLGVSSNINDLPFDEKVKVYPVPVINDFTVENAESAYLQIYTLNGEKLYETQIQSSKEIFSKTEAGLQSGVYILKILGENAIARRMIIVK